MRIKKGDILPRRPIAERLWEKVDKSAGPDGCWTWKGSTRYLGYGSIWSGGNRGKVLSTHRVAWELTRGPIPPDMCLDHICKNPPCCNPAHLRVVTYRQNYVDYSDSPHGKNGRKTHCLRGHEFDTTIYRRGKPSRACSICMKIRAARAMERYYARKQSPQESK